MTTFGHDWHRGEMANFPGMNDVQLYVWRCRRCKAIVKAIDSAGLPGRVHAVFWPGFLLG